MIKRTIWYRYTKIYESLLKRTSLTGSHSFLLIFSVRGRASFQLTKPETGDLTPLPLYLSHYPL